MDKLVSTTDEEWCFILLGFWKGYIERFGLMSLSKHYSPSASASTLPAHSRTTLCLSHPTPPSAAADWFCGLYLLFHFLLLMFQERCFQVSHFWPGKHWLGLPRIYVAVVHSQNVSYTKYRLCFLPMLFLMLALDKHPFVWMRKESHLLVSRIQNLGRKDPIFPTWF